MARNLPKSQTVAVIGVGYVGMPLLKRLLKYKFKVIAIDSDAEKIGSIKNGNIYNDNQFIRSHLNKSNLIVSDDIKLVSKANVIIICVPTPKVNDYTPDLSIITSVTESIAPHISINTLIVNESTSYVGNLRGLIKVTIEKIRPELKDKIKYGVAPERIDPGNKKYSIHNTPRIVAGIDKKSSIDVYNLYKKILPKVILVESPEIAEAAKLLENSFRLVNISFINEFSEYLMSLNINPNKVIEAATTKPFGFMKFNYGPGIGGHCIPVDPVYALWGSDQISKKITLIENALYVNQKRYDDISKKILQIIKKELIDCTLFDVEVVFIGIGYKANSLDTRESPAQFIASKLEVHGIKVKYISKKIKNWLGKENLASLKSINFVVILQIDDDIQDHLKNYKGIIINCSGVNLSIKNNEIFNI